MSDEQQQPREQTHVAVMQLPPGPRVPRLVQTIGWWTRTPTYLERLRRRHGSRFTLRLLGLPPAVFLSDPADARELFTAPPDVLHPGEGAGLLEPIVGRNSVILLNEDAHLEQCRLMLPAFRGGCRANGRRRVVVVDFSNASREARRVSVSPRAAR